MRTKFVNNLLSYSHEPTHLQQWQLHFENIYNIYGAQIIVYYE